ncbi:MAG: DNA-directed RNA polymerase subunit P [Candidatus Diapherotrites archaeon]|nr:DNA-directed RNA polymerase subunit P [Candidatus Diapherotrites archaeon]MDZ4256130.1 DNA-directed RNA polymerase subunit P [archaeon]
MYKCSKCLHQFDQLPIGLVRCANCGNKIFYKVRAPVEKKVQAR